MLWLQCLLYPLLPVETTPAALSILFFGRPFLSRILLASTTQLKLVKPCTTSCMYTCSQKCMQSCMHTLQTTDIYLTFGKV